MIKRALLIAFQVLVVHSLQNKAASFQIAIQPTENQSVIKPVFEKMANIVTIAEKMKPFLKLKPQTKKQQFF